jgi:hypothetical protein
VDDGSTGDEGRDLGFITLAAAARIAREHDAELDVDGPTREEWTAHQKRAPRRFRDLIPSVVSPCSVGAYLRILAIRESRGPSSAQS